MNLGTLTTHLRSLSVGLVLAGLAIAATLLLACGDDDGGVSSSGSASASVSGAPEPGVVQPQPSGSTKVDIVLKEWAVQASVASVPAGQIYFLVDNQGPEDPHEFVVIRTDLAPDRLPVDNGRVPEEKVQLLDEIEPFATKSKGSLSLNLTAGTYVLICNIAEIEDGQLESHYQLGMRTAFRVQ